MLRKTYTIFSRGGSGVSGVEIMANEKEGKSGKAGRVALRFFATGAKGFFLMEPAESFKLGCFIEECALSVAAGNSLKKKLPPHAAKKEDTVKATVTIDGWARNGKSGCSLQYAKGDHMFNIGLGGSEEARFVAAFLKDLAVQSAWLDGNYDAMSEGDGQHYNDQPDQAPAPETARETDNKVLTLKKLVAEVKADAKKMVEHFKVKSLEELAASDSYAIAIKMLEKKR